MGFERPKSKNDERADAVMRLIRDEECSSVPQAVKRILTNEGITHVPDVTRIMSEVGTVLQKRQQYAEEEAAWDDMERAEMLRGAEQAYRQRGGDPEY
jgi:trimethylamine:corrinoid methyltransferase-like protein